MELYQLHVVAYPNHCVLIPFLLRLEVNIMPTVLYSFFKFFLPKSYSDSAWVLFFGNFH